GRKSQGRREGRSVRRTASPSEVQNLDLASFGSQLLLLNGSEPLSYFSPPKNLSHFQVTWNDVAGLDELVSELRDAVILPLQQTRLFEHSKLCQPPKGILGMSSILESRGKRVISGPTLQLLPHFIPCQYAFLRNRSRTDHEATAMMKAEFMSLWDGLQTASDCQTQRQRQEILKLILAGEHMSNAVSLKELAEKTRGYSGSDLWELCRDAATYRVRDYVRKQQMRQIAHLLHRRGSVEETDLEENPLRPLTQLDLLLALEKMKESRGATSATLTEPALD
ncbi:ATPase family AAA domain-containing protein 1-A, partial [Ophiophagus hannah]